MDTARNLDAMNPSAMPYVTLKPVHPICCKRFQWSVVNAGDGINEHPSQALLDMLTIRDHLGSLEGKTVAIVGDIFHSRVARSNIFGLQAMGANVIAAGPGTMCPKQLRGLNVEIRHGIDDVLVDSDAIMMLRIQRERLGPAMLSTAEEYASIYGLDVSRLRRAKEVPVMHPGPINRGGMMPDVADSAQLSFKQVTNGIAIRMALFTSMSMHKIMVQRKRYDFERRPRYARPLR